jgi:hypothetical protein
MMVMPVDDLAVAAAAAVTAMLDDRDDDGANAIVNALFDDRPADAVFADRRDDLPMGLLLIIVRLLGALSDATGRDRADLWREFAFNLAFTAAEQE